MDRGLRQIVDAWIPYALPIVTLTGCAFCLRVYLCLPSKSSRAKKDAPLGGKGSNVKTIIYFGSGGHTAEMIRLIRKLDPAKYSPMLFAIGHTDISSIDKVRCSNLELEKSAKWLRIFRNREVKQSWFTTVFTSLWSLVQAFYVMLRSKPQLLICNGPGTCVSLCYSAFLLRVFGVARTRIVFVESFCRTEGLSLSGKLLLPIADRFIAQWPELVEISPAKIEYLGVIC